MKVLIVYYSQTGNTQKAAREIRDGFREAGAQVTLRFLKNAAFEELQEYDVIGFGSPIWYEMTPNMRKFVEDMPRLDGKLSFCFNTHGTLPALYFPLAIPRLQGKGLRVVDWRDWYGDCAIQIFPEPYYTDGHPDAQDLSEMRSWGKELAGKCERILKGEPFEFPKAPQPDMKPYHANAAIDHLGGFHNPHGALVRDPEKCLYPKCHICMDNCTMNFIDLSAAPQKYGCYGDKCDYNHGCTYCEMLCPTGAIHPEIPYEEACPVGQEHGSPLFEGVLAQAEKDGKFRRLIPFEEVGIKTPFYSVHSKHPRVRPLKFDDDK